MLPSNEKIGKYFTLAQLTATSKVPVGKNIPNESEKQNLKNLATWTLDPLYELVGHFTVEDAFRNEVVNNAVNGSKTSYHRLGLAADLRPAMGGKKFFAKVVNEPALLGLVGEIILNSDNVIHVSAPNPPKKYSPSFKDSVTGKYIAFTAEQLQKFIKDNGIAVSFGIAGVAFMGIVFWSMQKNKG